MREQRWHCWWERGGEAGQGRKALPELPWLGRSRLFPQINRKKNPINPVVSGQGLEAWKVCSRELFCSCFAHVTEQLNTGMSSMGRVLSRESSFRWAQTPPNPHHPHSFQLREQQGSWSLPEQGKKRSVKSRMGHLHLFAHRQRSYGTGGIISVHGWDGRDRQWWRNVCRMTGQPGNDGIRILFRYFCS